MTMPVIPPRESALRVVFGGDKVVIGTIHLHALRGAGPLTLADAIHLATARLAAATAFVTNDRRIRSIDRLEVLHLDALDLAEPRAGIGSASR